MNLNAADTFDFTVIPISIHAEVTSGNLSAATFDANLAAEIGAHLAVLFEPSGGDLDIAGHLFLIVDANGTAGYQAGNDYVAELQSAAGTVATSDFI